MYPETVVFALLVGAIMYVGIPTYMLCTTAVEVYRWFRVAQARRAYKAQQAELLS